VVMRGFSGGSELDALSKGAARGLASHPRVQEWGQTTRAHRSEFRKAIRITAEVASPSG